MNNLGCMMNLLLYNSTALFTIFNIDLVFKYFAISKNRESTRWFQLHAVINIIIAVFAYEDIIDCIFDPTRSNEIIRTEWARSFALSLHIYHALMYTLRQEDWMHHIISVFLCAPMCVVNNIKSVSFNYFFCTGLPGAIDYIILSLVRIGYVERITQKYIACLLNTYVRMPGGCLGACLLFKDAFQPEGAHINRILLSMIIYGNSTFYGKQAIGSYFKTNTEHHILQNMMKKSKQHKKYTNKYFNE